jgi:hypothetical protein
MEDRQQGTTATPSPSPTAVRFLPHSRQ